LKDKVVICTGSTSGIGFETARSLASVGAHVIIPYRNEEKYQETMKYFNQTVKDGKFTGIPLDLAEFSSIDKFVEEFKKLNLPLHRLILNAGIMCGPERQVTKEGFEMTVKLFLKFNSQDWSESLWSF
jgi:WW domain-containing oxidoreductase